MLIEALAVIGLIVLLTPMIFMRVSDYSDELEDGATASRLRLLRQGLSTYMEMNYENIINGTAEIQQNGTIKTVEALDDDVDQDFIVVDIDDPELQRYIRPEYYKSNLFDDVKVTVSRFRIEPPIIPDAEPEEIPKPLIVLNGMILTKNNDATDVMSFKRGRRIANIIGSDTGHITDVKEITGSADLRAVGAGGFFNLPVNNHFPSGDIQNGQIVVTTGSYYPLQISLEASSEVEGDFLFRRESVSDNYDVATAHRMETDIDFGVYTDDDKDEVYDLTGSRSVVEVNRIMGMQNTAKVSADNAFEYSEGLEASTIQKHQGYAVDFENKISFLEDMQVATLGGAKISEVLPDVILMGIFPDVDYGYYMPTIKYFDPLIVKENACPTGFTQKIELIQKETISSVDILALAQHGSSSTGIHSSKSWLQNLKLRRSQYKNGSTTYYRTYTRDGKIAGECSGDSNYHCNVYEYVDGNAKLSQQCKVGETVIYNVSSSEPDIDTENFKAFNTHSAKKVAYYKVSSNQVQIYSPPGNLVVNYTSGQLTCKNRAFCPDFKGELGVATAVSMPDLANGLYQHGSCQATINTIENGDNFLPYGANYTSINADGTSGSTVTTSATMPALPSDGVYYNTRLYYKENAFDTMTQVCKFGGTNGTKTTISGKANALCNVAAKNRRFSLLPTRVDMYLYCVK